MRLKWGVGIALWTKLEPPFGNHRLQTLGILIVRKRSCQLRKLFPTTVAARRIS